MASPVTLNPITFSDPGVGTVDPVYSYNDVLADGKTLTVSFSGQIVTDASDPTSPAIASDPSYMGPVGIRFSDPVSSISFDAGAFNNLHSTRIIIYGRNDFVIAKVQNSVDTSVYEHFSFNYGENAIVRVRLVPVGAELAGFAVDNVAAEVRPESKDATLSGTQAIDTLIKGKQWDGNDVTYSFIKADSKFPGYGTGPTTFDTSDVRVNTHQPLNGEQQIAALRAVAQWQGVSLLHFTETDDTAAAGPGMIRLGQAAITAPADAYFPGLHPEAGDVWVQPGKADHPSPGNYAQYVFLHELGHALGLKHPHSGGLGPTMPAMKDSIEFSIMSYRSYPGADVTQPLTTPDGSFPTSLMMNDIAAIQHLYGANFGFRSGDDVYSFNPGQKTVFRTIWDGGGTDRYDCSAYDTAVTLDLRPGQWCVLDRSQLAVLDDDPASTKLARGSVFNALLYKGDERSLIENATGGSGNDALTGNQVRNVLDGQKGQDLLDGLGGRDVLLGGLGNDRLYGGSGADEMKGGAGADRLEGGGGADTFFFLQADDSLVTRRDHVLDFNQGEDHFDISALDGDLGAEGQQGFTVIGQAAFSGAGQIAYSHTTLNTVVSINLNRDAAPEMQFVIGGAVDLTAADFGL